MCETVYFSYSDPYWYATQNIINSEGNYTLMSLSVLHIYNSNTSMNDFESSQENS